MKRWEEYEYSPALFWSSTPRQIAASLRAYEEILTRRHNERAWSAWHTGALSHPMKRFPPLENFQIKSRKHQKRQPWQQQLAIAHMWASRNKGKMGKVN